MALAAPLGAAVAVLAGYGWSTVTPSASASPQAVAHSGSGGTVRVVQGVAWDSLDPAVAATPQSLEATWLVYTGLLTTSHTSSLAGTKVIPGLATGMPLVTNGGKTYTMTLRKGLVYSNGEPVKASDFLFAVDRSIRMNWGQINFLVDDVVGAPEVLNGKAKAVSGIQVNDSTGKIVIHLTHPDTVFPWYLTWAGFAPIPASTPVKAQGTNPPPGVGPYMIENVVPSQSYTLARNPYFALLRIPGIPVGYANAIQVQVVSNPTLEAEDVFDGQADLFDTLDTVTPAMLSQIESQASGRFSTAEVPSDYFFSLNTTKKPFSSELARRAAVLALNKQAMVRLASGFLSPSCYLLPAGVPGYVSAPCPYYGPANSAGNIAKAKQLVQQSGMAGTSVTVYGYSQSPVQQWTDYYASVLNEIGFKATEKILSPSVYFNTVNSPSVAPQTAFANAIIFSTNPASLFNLVDARNIFNGQDPSRVSDPKVQNVILKLDGANQTTGVVRQWTALDRYVTGKSYMLIFGSLREPVFTSSRIDHPAFLVNAVNGGDWSTLKLK